MAQTITLVEVQLLMVLITYDVLNYSTFAWASTQIWMPASAVREMAALLLARLLTRPDMTAALSEFMTWQQQSLAAASAPAAVFLLPGILQELAEEVVDGALALLSPSEPDSAWHGGCLAIAELARRSILPPCRLPDVTELLQQALAYDVRRGPHSVGAHVRDAAAYVCWALARAYEPGQLQGCVAALAGSLLVVACYDREVNCRRAAASAFQECVGRLGSFSHGLEILAVADYYSVGGITNAYLRVAPFVAQFDEYRAVLVQQLVASKLRHWDRPIRALAAMGLAALVPVAGELLQEQALPQLLLSVTDDVLEVRAGAVLGIAELLPAFAAAGVVQLSSAAMGGATSGLQGLAGAGVVGVLERLEAARMYRGKGGEVMREVAARFVEQNSIQVAGVAALRAYASAYQVDAGPRACLGALMQQCCSRLTDRDVLPAARKGAAAALGVLPAGLLAGMETAVLGVLADTVLLLEGAALAAQLACVPDTSASAIQLVMVLLVNRFPKVRRHTAEQLYLQVLAVQAEGPAHQQDGDVQQVQSVFGSLSEEDVDSALDVLLTSAWDGPLDIVRSSREELASHLHIDIKTRGSQASRAAARSKKNGPAAASRLQADPCLPTLNFFPTADEIGAKQLVNNKTCSGKQVCNFPAVWQEQNQGAYVKQLNTSLGNGLLRVAFKQYGNERPRLFFTPVTKFLKSGADVTACVASINPAATRRRSLLEAGTKYYVTKAGLWSYSVSYNGSPAEKGLQIAGQSGQLDPTMLAKDGSHCANITVTVEDMEIWPAVNSFPKRLQSVQSVCWFKISTQPSAKVKFDMCTNQKFTLNISNIHPLVQNLTQNGSNVVVNGQQQLLLRPMIHLFGHKNKSLDGTVLRELEFDRLNNPINFINKYIMLPTNLTAEDTFTFVMDQDYLDEGYYQLQAKLAMVTKFPNLVDLDGKGLVVQNDAYGEDVRGYSEYLGVTLVNETELVGVQRSKTTMSEIVSDKTGQPIQSGEKITFEWKMVGIGKETCYHDDVMLPECKSPLSVEAMDVSSKDTQHTFRVEFTDVCGETKDAKFTYTQTGVTPVSKVDYTPSADALASGSVGRTAAAAGSKNAKNAGSVSSTSFATSLLMGVLGVLLMVATL
eukprot:gene9794-9952_t